MEFSLSDVPIIRSNFDAQEAEGKYDEGPEDDKIVIVIVVRNKNKKSNRQIIDLE